LKFGAAFDYLNAADVPGHAWDAALYGTYQFNDKLSLNLRAEYYDGAALNAAGAYNQNNPNVFPPVTGYGTTQGSYEQAQELTATLQYALWANVLTRLEIRWDHANHGNGYSNGTGTTTNSGETFSVGGARQDAFMFAAQAIYTF
jgi:hypothetical protein